MVSSIGAECCSADFSKRMYDSVGGAWCKRVKSAFGTSQSISPRKEESTGVVGLG